MQTLSPIYSPPRPSRPVTMFAGASAGRSTSGGDPHEIIQQPPRADRLGNPLAFDET